MSDEPRLLVKQNSFDMVREKGRELLEENDFFKDLSSVMENDEFSSFFKKYFNNKTEAKITIIYMKLYQEFKDKWRELNDAELDARINAYLLWKMMRNKDSNKFAIQTIKDNLENPKRVNIFNELREYFEYKTQKDENEQKKLLEQKDENEQKK